MLVESFSDNRHFYPRSPCGERQIVWSRLYFTSLISIHALLAESDTAFYADCLKSTYFYPRSPCGERLDVSGVQGYRTLISIHALLAESDSRPILGKAAQPDFYPRSPCGERPGAKSTTPERY